MKDRILSTFSIGMGCWAIGGPFYNGNESLGWGAVDDKESARTLHAAYDSGIRIFDTAAAYGAGHSETILGEAIGAREDCIIVTKLGLEFDESSKELIGPVSDSAAVMPAIEESLRRLQRETIDVLLLHLNDLPIDKAEHLFQEMNKACEQGKVKGIGWSTDYPESIKAMSDHKNFIAIEHCLNVFVDSPSVQDAVSDSGFIPLIRSPLAMGVLTGKYTIDTRFDKNDNRSRNEAWRDYFIDAAVDPIHLSNLEAVRECLTVDGRSLTQGALNWIMAKSPNSIPIPGARTVDQITESASAAEFGPLPEHTMKEIEILINRSPEGNPRGR